MRVVVYYVKDGCKPSMSDVYAEKEYKKVWRIGYMGKTLLLHYYENNIDKVDLGGNDFFIIQEENK